MIANISQGSLKMLNGDEVLAQLKFDKDVNVLAASKWSDETIKEMLETYSQTKKVAKETKNNSLFMIAEEKMSQLKLALDLKTKSAKKSNELSI